jgi:hypothetical protein
LDASKRNPCHAIHPTLRSLQAHAQDPSID